MAFDGGGLIRGELAIAKKNSSLTLNKYSRPDLRYTEIVKYN
jgi:hypothetical protein